MDEIRSHHLRSPGMIRFPCKSQRAMVSSMVSKWCERILSISSTLPGYFNRQRQSVLLAALHEGTTNSLQMGVGQNETTRKWTAGFGPCFHLPGFHVGYLFLTHSSMSRSKSKVGQMSRLTRFFLRNLLKQRQPTQVASANACLGGFETWVCLFLGGPPVWLEKKPESSDASLFSARTDYRAFI